MSASSTRERLALLECAYDAGITHFDTAAYYGFGEAERLLGTFLAGKRDTVTLTTKFGIEPSGMVKARWVNLAARRVIKAAPFLRKMLGKRQQGGSTWGVFEPEKAALSLERSLRALRTDCIDLFLLHEPGIDAAASDSLLAFLQAQVEKGRIKAFGCGGEGDRINRIAEAGLETSHWLQFEDNVVTRRIERIRATGAKCITFAPFNSALRSLQTYLDEYPEQRAEWSRLLDADCSSPEVLSGLLQASSHQRNADGIVLFSSSRSDRITRAAEIAGGSTFSAAQLLLFEELTSPLAHG